MEHIGSSSSVLLTIVNDILDLATVDAGIMQLDIAEVRIAETVGSAADLIAERLKEIGVRLELDIDGAPDAFQADGHRVRQILFNLLSNAAKLRAGGRASSRSAAAATAMPSNSRSMMTGPACRPKCWRTIFRRFEPRTNGGRKRGAGLGLSIVKSFRRAAWRQRAHRDQQE